MSEKKQITLDDLSDKQKMEFKSFMTYAKHAKLILRDMNQANVQGEFFKKYKREDVVKWLETPQKFEKKLIEISKYCYMVSPHYRRICDYFSKMSLLSYIVLPYKLNKKNFKKRQFLDDYKTTIDNLQVMNIQNEYAKLITEMFIADTVYVYEYSTNDSYFCRILPYDRCEISSIVDGVFQFQFDFQYFDKYPKQLVNYGSEFIAKYELYKKDKSKYRWQQLNDKHSFALKLSDNVPYAIPIFANLITTIFDLEDLRQIEKTKNKLAVYKLLLMKLPVDEEGNFTGGDFNKALEYYDFLCESVDETVGVGMSPYDVKDYTFENAGTTNNINTYSESVSQFFTASGVSELLFNSSKSSSATISSSIKNDSEMVFHIHRMIERVVNKKLKQAKTEYLFSIKMLDVTTYNQKEVIENVMKGAQVGESTSILSLPAAMGFTPAESYGSDVLVKELDLVNKWNPVKSSHTQSGNSDITNKGGAPKKDDDQLSESGVQTRNSDNRRQEE